MPITAAQIIQAAVLILLLLNMLLLIIRTGRGDSKGLPEAQQEMLDELEERIAEIYSRETGSIRRDIESRLNYDAEENRRNRIEVSEMLERNRDKQEQLIRTVLKDIQESNKVRLDEIRADINRKLDSSLNERLDSSFKNVGDQLNRLYESLGELSRLENGVNSLNRTLSNVKTRGIFGEVQLERILEDVLPSSLYDKNVITKKKGSGSREAVEFAVRIPEKDGAGGFMYLPVDSKFPMTCFEHISEASERSDPGELRKAVKELEMRVRSDARDIMEKYLDPPNTTDFAVMFLPTESLYAEVLRIPGLMDECRSKYHIVITGPSTAAALLNSLSIGFRYMAVNRDSQNIMKLLSAIKTQYATLSRLIDTAGVRIDSAKKATEELQHRTDIINRRLSSVEELDPFEADMLLKGTAAAVTDEVTEDFLD
ncbi:MAG: DNA recombination protein RmuC [Clostridiales bacterium]|nr:DNA recombination protein RmuC [Clostridiales bacterium]